MSWEAFLAFVISLGLCFEKLQKIKDFFNICSRD